MHLPTSTANTSTIMADMAMVINGHEDGKEPESHSDPDTTKANEPGPDISDSLESLTDELSDDSHISASASTSTPTTQSIEDDSAWSVASTTATTNPSIDDTITLQNHVPVTHPFAAPDMNLIFDYSPIPSLLLSSSGCITRVSKRFCQDWHVTEEDCIGKFLLPFLESQVRETGASKSKHIAEAVDDAVASRAERTSKAITVKSSFTCRARVIPIFREAELVSVYLEWQERPSSDVFDNELAQPGLSTDEAFRILVQALKDYAIFLLDTKGHIATWNTGAQLLKGYTRKEIIGKHFSIFYGKEDLDIKKPEMELDICLREGRVEDEGWRYKKDGSRFWANVVITAVYKNGVHVGFGKVTRDLTERKTSESRLIAAYEESEKLKSEFLANMSHEIRTPMHGMLSACALLLDSPLTERQRDIVNIMDESGQILLQVINDILDYSKLASGSFSVSSDVVGVASIITSVVRSVQTTLPPAVHFELFLAPNLPKSVQGDPLRYRQIVQNIIGNAAKFTDKGSIRVKASVHSEDSDSYTLLTEVIDTGIGIRESASASLFTPFSQFDLTTTKRYKGTGLGLSIAKSLTELMGGRIGYRPNPERHGSVFWFTARFKKIKSLEQIQDWKHQMTAKDGSPISLVQPDVTILQKRLASVAGRKSVLLVEDNIINQKVMLGMMRSLGFKSIDLAADGAASVKMVTGKPVGYDIVLMDINMPVMDGHEASQRIRDAGVKVPIIAMTAYALKGDREKCLEFGMNDYVPKPVDRKYLIKVLATWLLEKVDYRKAYDERLQQLKNCDEKLHRLSVSEGAALAGVRRDGEDVFIKPGMALGGEEGDENGRTSPVREGEKVHNAGVAQGTFEEPACVKIPIAAVRTERPNEGPQPTPTPNDGDDQLGWLASDDQKGRKSLPNGGVGEGKPDEEGNGDDVLVSEGEMSPRTPDVAATDQPPWERERADEYETAVKP
ncbi:putative histidine kinase [Pseudoneurospora amorphoporcata]|uniref:Histidine kinase n=1 Tax=Pseudoneurospora amorphoporcata TaxID=241081 RepID=A0AAN6NJT8_9PEZI|nr:putative histidine kinase [Pseudoneurospora amorphoporcata]